MSSRTKFDHCRLGDIEVVDEHIEVHLLGPLLSRPRRRRVTGHLMEGDALAILSADRSRVRGVVDLPIQHRAVEPGERTRIGTVDSEEGHASDGHAGQNIGPVCLRHRERHVSAVEPRGERPSRPISERQTERWQQLTGYAGAGCLIQKHDLPCLVEANCVRICVDQQRVELATFGSGDRVLHQEPS